MQELQGTDFRVKDGEGHLNIELEHAEILKPVLEKRKGWCSCAVFCVNSPSSKVGQLDDGH